MNVANSAPAQSWHLCAATDNQGIVVDSGAVKQMSFDPDARMQSPQPHE